MHDRFFAGKTANGKLNPNLTSRYEKTMRADFDNIYYMHTAENARDIRYS